MKSTDEKLKPHDLYLLYTIPMPKDLIKRYMPDHQVVRENRYLKIFGTLLHSPDLWHLNRRSVTGAFAVGMFMAWVPIPTQMVVSAALAILIRVNLPISVGLVWLSNPLTIPPLFYFAYLVGTWVLGMPVAASEFQLSVEWFEAIFPQIWKPFLLGCLINATVSSVLGYYGMHYFWVWHVRSRWKQRGGKNTDQESTPSTN